ncbi:MAG: protein-glutamine glutaminase family protein [Myxococcota bacterium]
MTTTLPASQLATLRAVFGGQIPGDKEAAIRMLDASPLAPADASARVALREQLQELAGKQLDALRVAGDNVAASRPLGTGQQPLPSALRLRLAELTGTSTLQGARANDGLKAVLTLAEAQQAAAMLHGRADIPWSFLDEGCMFRAHYGAWLLEQTGFQVDKIVSHSKNGGDLRLNSSAHPAGFTLSIYHMALCVVVEENGELKRKVIDPAFSGEPMDIADWHRHMQAPGRGPLETYFMPRFVEMPWQLAEDAPTGWSEAGLNAARTWHQRIHEHPFFQDQQAWCTELQETWQMMEESAKDHADRVSTPSLPDATS